MDLYKLFINDIIKRGNGMIDDAIMKPESVSYINSLKRNVNFSIQNQARGFLSCMVLNNIISNDEMSVEMDKIMRDFPI